MKIVMLSLMIVALAIIPNLANADAEKDPFAGPEDDVLDGNAPDETKPRVVTDEGRKTLEILRTEKFDLIRVDPDNPQRGFELLKAKLKKRGVTVRLKHYGDPMVKHQPGGPLALRNVPLDEFMKYFDQWAWWGWILYPDGSITCFDGICSGNWPKMDSIVTTASMSLGVRK